MLGKRIQYQLSILLCFEGLGIHSSHARVPAGFRLGLYANIPLLTAEVLIHTPSSISTA
jgi:hypothetical protein